MGFGMSALIKSAAAPAIRPLARFQPPIPGPEVQVPDPGEAERRALRSEIARLEAALADAERGVREDIALAREEGRRAGLKEAQSLERERLATLEEGVREAVSGWNARLELVDGLAPLLAKAALSKLFEAREDWVAMVEASLARQLGQLRRSAVVAIRVSAKDFSGDAAEALGQRLGMEGVEVSADTGLAPGACRIECRLGEIDLDVPAQCAELAAALDAMAERGA